MVILGVMEPKLFVVIGAPGSGKSTAAQAFIQRRTSYLAYDIDWLGMVASDLAGKDIFFEPSTWKPYGALWFEVLHAAYRNGRIAVFFSPNTPSDFASLGLPAWCRAIEWLLLDCDNVTRRERLRSRPEWTAPMIEDARDLRSRVTDRVDTARETPAQVARSILFWLDSHGLRPV